MQTENSISTASFLALFQDLLPDSMIEQVLESSGPRKRRPPAITSLQLIQSLVYHMVAGGGTFAQHALDLSGISVGDSALSQRRALMPMTVFEQLMELALAPKADPQLHPEAFFRGLRICGLDGSTASVTNTPQIKTLMSKSKSRRGRSAFPKVGMAVMVELGLHNPLSAAIGANGQSEMVLASKLLAKQPEKSLLLMDRYYGSGEVLMKLNPEGDRHFLARVKANLKSRLVQRLKDGSALVEIRSGDPVVDKSAGL